MNEMKEKFKKWLLEQRLTEKTKSDNPSTITTYTNAIDRICKERFPADYKLDPNKSWRLLCEEIVPVAAKYSELSHKEYMLDRVIIWYAIDYFSKIFNFIYENGNWDQKPEVDLYLFHNKQNYFIKTIFLHELNEYTQYFAALCFNHNFEPSKINPDHYDEFKEILDKMIWDKKIKNIREVGFHIVYKQFGCNNKRGSLDHFYHCFINPTLTQPLNQHKMIMAIRQERPDKDQFYLKTQEITGIQPLQIVAKTSVLKRSLNLDCVLQQRHLVEVFDIDSKSIRKYLKNKICFDGPNDKEVIEETGKTYYSVDRTNEYLLNGYEKTKLSCSDDLYKKEGYSYWKRKSQIIHNIIPVGKDAFDTLCGKNVVRDKNNKLKFVDTPRICYFGQEQNRRYYTPAFADYVAKKT